MTAPRLKLLTAGNPKTSKGAKYGYATAVLHLAPSTLSGRNVCPMASPGCIEGCLNLAGRGGLAPRGNLGYEEVLAGIRTNKIQDARIRRTKRFYEDRNGFLADLDGDIGRWVAWCLKEGYRPAVRLNGTSDLPWEAYAADVMAKYAGEEGGAAVQFYDYTKVYKRIRASLYPEQTGFPANYHLTFSQSESNEDACATVLALGGTVATVFRTKDEIPDRWLGYPTINGDAHDLRFLDSPGSVVALYAKGPWAKRDRSGFVKDAL